MALLHRKRFIQLFEFTNYLLLILHQKVHKVALNLKMAQYYHYQYFFYSLNM